jgi:hypothetical protein
LPERDRGIDLIAYADLDSTVSSFIARPIQMKAASKANFSIDRKYEKFPDLILAFVWHLDSPEDARTYALSYGEALSISERLGWTTTPSWIERGRYSTQKPSHELVGLLEGHRMTPRAWWSKIVDPRRLDSDDASARTGSHTDRSELLHSP